MYTTLKAANRNTEKQLGLVTGKRRPEPPSEWIWSSMQDYCRLLKRDSYCVWTEGRELPSNVTVRKATALVQGAEKYLQWVMKRKARDFISNGNALDNDVQDDQALPLSDSEVTETDWDRLIPADIVLTEGDEPVEGECDDDDEGN